MFDAAVTRRFSSRYRDMTLHVSKIHLPFSQPGRSYRERLSQFHVAVVCVLPSGKREQGEDPGTAMEKCNQIQPPRNLRTASQILLDNEPALGCLWRCANSPEKGFERFPRVLGSLPLPGPWNVREMPLICSQRHGRRSPADRGRKALWTVSFDCETWLRTRSRP